MNSRDDLRQLWESQPLQSQTKGEDIVAQVEARIRRFDQNIRMRNLVEVVASAILMLIFIRQAWGAHDGFTFTGSILVSSGAAWIIFHLLRYGQPPVDADPTLNSTNFTYALTERYDQQIRLIRSAKVWYLLPMYAGIMIISAKPFFERHQDAGSYAVPVFVTLVFAVIWWLNDVAAVRHLKRECAKLLAMSSDDGDDFSGHTQPSR